jgi:hypothetical protein
MALAPGRPAQPVAELDVVDIGAGWGRKWNQPRNSPVDFSTAAQKP